MLRSSLRLAVGLWLLRKVFRAGRWVLAFLLVVAAWPVTIVAAVYLLVMFVDMVAPTGLSSPRGALFNLDWITLVVMVVVFIVGAILFLLARGGRELDEHLRDDAEKPAALR